MLTVWRLTGGGYFQLCYSDGTRFVVDRNGAQIWATWPDTSTLEDLSTYLLGPVMGFVLRLRGATCLHASAIVVDNQAIALVGVAGAGKSTTAAAFAEQGYPVLSDDIVALWDRDGSFFVQPGYPRLRLWPSSVDALYGPEGTLPRLTPTWDKRYLDLTRGNYQFQREPLPMAAVYLLQERCNDPKAPFVEPLSASAGMMALVANTYATNLLDKTMRAREFESLGRLITTVLLRRVISHADPIHLSKLCDVILDDFHTLSPSVRAVSDARQK